MMKAYRVLVVDDDAPLTELLRHALRLEGYDVEIALDGETALALCAKLPPDLVILDLMMPGMDGFAVLEQLRQTSTVPVIVLSAKRTAAVKTRALNEGADDYLAKPFDLEELLARMNAVLRRASFSLPAENAAVRRFDRLCVDPQKRSVTLGENRLRLTPTEYALLLEFATHPGEVLSHRTLLQRVWGLEHRAETQYLHIYVQRLRSKIEDDPAHPRYIVTEHGVGYCFYPPAPTNTAG